MSCINTTINNNRGSAILLVVSIGALVTLLVFSWVVFSGRRYHAVIDKRDDLRARYAAESVISQVVYEKMVNPAVSLKKPDSLVINSLPDSAFSGPDDPLTYNDSLHKSSADATAEEEGSYFRVKAQGNSGSAICGIDALFGIEMPPQYRYALVLSGAGDAMTRPLEIKRGRIIGDVKLPLPPKGLINGRIDTGSAGFPPVKESAFESEIQRFENRLRAVDSSETVLPVSQVFTDKSPPPISRGKDLFVNGNLMIENRSGKPFVVRGPGTVIAAGDIQISGGVIVDNVEILALGSVQCFDDARLQRVTVYSKRMIGFGDRVTVSGNLYADEKLVLAGQAAVEMPAFAYVNGPDSQAAIRNFGLQLSRRSRFSGTFYCRGRNTVSFIERDARFTGLFYSRGHLILDGAVSGCVVAQTLLENAVDIGSRNVLAGGTINRKLLPDGFILPCAFGRPGTSYSLVSWAMTSSRGNSKGAGR